MRYKQIQETEKRCVRGRIVRTGYGWKTAKQAGNEEGIKNWFIFCN